MSVSIDRFLAAITASGVLSAAETEQLASGIPADKRAENAEELARDLVRQGKLTRYQAAAIYQDKGDGLVLGNYILLDKLGAGGMGQVFRARHRRMDRVVALKLLPQKALCSPTAVARFQREVKAAARLTHPNIVTAHDADEAGGQHFLVMEYIEGSDLAGLVKSQGPLAPAQALDYLFQAARGLGHAHAEGIVHRDIKPSNLLLDKRGTVKILDMGLALVSDPLAEPGSAPGAGLTQSGSIMGTIDYMAPEQAMDCRQADARSDIYSLGCTLHFLLTGRSPYGGDTVLKRLTAHQQAAVPMLSSSRADIPPGVQEVFSRMMAKRPAARYQTADELVAALQSLRNQPATAQSVPAAAQPAAAQPVIAQPVARPVMAVAAMPVSSVSHSLSGMESLSVERRSRNVKKSRSKAPLVAAAVLLLAAVGAGAWMMSEKQPDKATQAGPLAPMVQAQTLASPEPTVETHQKPAKVADAAQPAVEPVAKSTSSKVEPPVTAASPVSSAEPAVVSNMPNQPIDPVGSPPMKSASAPPPVQEPPAADGKLPIPDTERRRDALKLIKELYKGDYAAAKQPDAKAALAEKLLNQAQENRDDDASLYALLEEARDLAVDAANPALADRAIGMLAGRFVVEPLKELVASLSEMTGKPHPADANRKIAEAALARMDEALTVDDFDTAKQLADTALAAARKSKDSALTKRAVEVGKAVNAGKQRWDGWKKTQAILAQTPDDPAANLAAGRYLALVQGDWQQGLAHLAKGPDGPLKELAAKGLSPPTDSAALAEMGDAWFAAAEKAKGKDKADLRAGAAYWYSLADPGLTGLAKTIVEKRLKELGGMVAAAQMPSAEKLPATIEVPLAAGVSMNLRLIPAGTFTMGASGGVGGVGEEDPHQVNITRPFYLGVTEVTQAQWSAAMGSNSSGFPGDPARPVEKVSWNDCQAFLETLNARFASRKLRFRLPTEAEWEYACRAGTKTKYYFGDDPAMLPQFAWFKANSAGTTHPVGRLAPNAWGLFDMHGNVWEFCSDWHALDYYKHSPTDDPRGPATGSRRILRSGGWANLADACEAARRNLVVPDVHYNNYGLRVAADPARTTDPAALAARGGSRGTKTVHGSATSGGQRPVAFAQAELERSVAKWVLSIGGKVKVVPPAATPPTSDPPEITSEAQLPAEPFIVFGIDLFENKQVTDKDLERLPGLMNLVELRLTSTSIGDPGMAHIARLPKLKLLYLHNANVTDAGLAALDSLNELAYLFLSSTKTSDAGFTHLRGLSELRSLGIQNTGLTDAGIKNLAGMRHLRWLAISGTKITDEALKEVPKNSELSSIELRNTKISNAGLAQLRLLPLLSSLNLDHTPIDDQGLEILAAMANLKELHLAGTKTTDVGVEQFKRLRPNCKIFR